MSGIGEPWTSNYKRSWPRSRQKISSMWMNERVACQYARDDLSKQHNQKLLQTKQSRLKSWPQQVMEPSQCPSRRKFVTFRIYSPSHQRIQKWHDTIPAESTLDQNLAEQPISTLLLIGVIGQRRWIRWCGRKALHWLDESIALVQTRTWSGRAT